MKASGTSALLLPAKSAGACDSGLPLMRPHDSVRVGDTQAPAVGLDDPPLKRRKTALARTGEDSAAASGDPRVARFRP